MFMEYCRELSFLPSSISLTVKSRRYACPDSVASGAGLALAVSCDHAGVSPAPSTNIAVKTTATRILFGMMFSFESLELFDETCSTKLVQRKLANENCLTLCANFGVTGQTHLF